LNHRPLPPPEPHPLFPAEPIVPFMAPPMVPDEKVDQTINYMFEHPLHFGLQLRDCTDLQKKRMFRALHQVFTTVIVHQAVTNRFMLVFETNKGFKRKPLTPEVYHDILLLIEWNAFDYEVEETPEEPYDFSDTPNKDLIIIIIIIFFGIEPIMRSNETKVDKMKPRQKTTRNSREGQFWPYLNTTKLDLTKYQIFDSLTNEKGRPRKELNDCCFIYALQQTKKFSEDLLELMRFRIHNRMLNQSKVRKVAHEFGIDLIIHYIEDDTQNPETNHKKSRQVKSRSEKDAPDYEFEVQLNLYQGHFFLEE
jgi:hypothetical protein